MEYTNLRDRALTINSLRDQSYRNLVNAELVLKQKTDELKSVKEDLLIQESALKILRQLLDTMAESHINNIVDMITFALQTIFHDKDYSVKIVISEARSTNTAELILIDSTNKDEEPIESEIPESVGGGVSSVIGFVLQVFYILYFKLNKIMLIDEYLSAVSIDYLPNLMLFIKQLAEKRQFRFLAICHDVRFYPYADFMYKMVDGKLIKLDDYDGGEDTNEGN